MTTDYGITGALNVFVFTDVKHATMRDVRSVTGSSISVGRGRATVFDKFSKQTIVVESSIDFYSVLGYRDPGY